MDGSVEWAGILPEPIYFHPRRQIKGPQKKWAG